MGLTRQPAGTKEQRDTPSTPSLSSDFTFFILAGSVIPKNLTTASRSHGSALSQLSAVKSPLAPLSHEVFNHIVNCKKELLISPAQGWLINIASGDGRSPWRPLKD